MALGPRLKWIKSELKEKKNLTILFIISLTLSFLIVRNFEVNYLLNSILIGSALYLFFVTTTVFFKKRNERLGQNLAHFGFSLLILSILFNNFFSKETITNLKVGENYKNNQIEIIFNDLTKENKKNYVSYTGIFTVKNNNFNGTLKPELRVYNQPKTITSEADIKISLLRDNFITINNVENEDYFNVRYLVKPFMLWIWVSVILIILGGLISLSRKIYEK